MALSLLTRVATKALGNIGETISGAASGAFNYLQKNAPDILSNFNNPANIGVNSYLPKPLQENAQEGVANVGRFLQKMPDTTIKAPEPPAFIDNVPKPISLLFDNPISQFQGKAGEFLSGIPGEMIRETGQALEFSATPEGRQQIAEGLGDYPGQFADLFTGQGEGGRMQTTQDLLNNPATITAFGLTNIPSPKNLIKPVLREVTEQGVKKGTKEAVEEVVTNPNLIDDITGNSTERLFRPKDSRQVDFVADEAGNLQPVKEASKRKTAELFSQQPPVETVDGGFGGLLNAPKTLSLPQPQAGVSITQLRQLAKNGDNLEGVSFAAKNADEAREALSLGLPANKIEIPKAGTKTDTLFAGEDGLSRAIDPAEELLEQSIKQGARSTKPLNWFSEKTLEPVRAIPKMLGDVAESAKRAVFDPLEKAKGNSAVFQKEWLKKVSEAVPFKAGSKESAAIQQLGEEILSADQVIRQFGKKKGEQIIKANEFFRSTYDEVLSQVNARRIAAGMDEIPRRNDYYRHFQEGGSSWLDTLLTGNTGNSALSSSILKQRKGEKTIFDAVGGFGEYIQKAGRAGYTDEFAGKIDNLAKELKANGADPKISEYLQQYAKEGILGEREIKDLGTVLNAARGVTMAVGNTVKRNAILFNARSLVMQVANVPNAVGLTLGTDKKGALYVMKGLSNFAKNKDAMAKSAFLTDRASNLPRQFVRPGRLGVNKIQDLGGRALQQTDLMPSRYIWNTFYEQALGNKVKNPIQYADDMAKKMIGGRGIGDLSPAQRSPVGNLAFPFGVEWANSAHVLGDMIGKKQVGGLIATVALYHVFNKGMEKVTGTPALFDPIQAAMDSAEYATGSDDREQSTIKAVGRFVAELANVSPYSQNILSLAYSGAEMAGAPDAREIFGSEDPTRFGNISLYSPLTNDGLKSPGQLAAQYNPVGGGNQIKKTIEGISAGIKGYTESAAGNIHNAVSQNPLQRVQMAIFGQWANPDSDEHFGSDFSRPLFDDERAEMEALPADQRSDFVRATNEERREKNRADSYFDDEDEGWFGKLTGGNNKKEPTEDAILNHYFEGKTYDTANRKERTSMLNSLVEVMEDEKLSPEMKAKITSAAGVSSEDLAYYQGASLSQEDRLEAVLELANQDYETRDDLINQLAMGKRSVGGKAMFSTAMFDRLYDDGLISKDEKALLSAIKYDPIYNKFYMDRDYKGASGSGGGMTASKIKSYITSINSLHKNTFGKVKAEKTSDAEKDLTLPDAPKFDLPRLGGGSTKKSTAQWFTPY